jgi:alpha-mannosidase
VTLWAHEGPDPSYLRLHARIANERPDHRLRLHVALDEQVEGSSALSAFEVVGRPLRSEGSGLESPSPTWPARGGVMAGTIAILCQGVFEYEVRTEPPELAVTLLRCVGTISRVGLATRPSGAGPGLPTPEAQMIGEYHQSFTFRRGLSAAELPAAWEATQLPIRSVHADGGGDLPPAGSLLEIEGAELSSIRRLDGDLEVRIWNPSNVATTARVGDRRLDLGPARIEAIRLPGPIRR